MRHLPRKQCLINRDRYQHASNKGMIAIDRLSIKWKSDLTDKIKRSFFQAVVVSILIYGCTIWTPTKRMEKKLDDNYTRILQAILNRSWKQHLTKLDEPDMQDTAEEVWTNSQVTYSCEPIHMDEQRQDDQLEPTYSSSVPILNVILKTWRKQ